MFCEKICAAGTKVSREILEIFFSPYCREAQAQAPRWKSSERINWRWYIQRCVIFYEIMALTRRDGFQNKSYFRL